MTIGTVAVDPNDPNVIWVGTGENNRGCESYFGIGLLRSPDGGATWELRNGTDFATLDDMASFANVIIDPRDSNHIITGGRIRGCADGSGPPGGIYTTNDGGQAWIARLANTEVYEIAQDPAVLDIYWAATSRGIYKSTDNGVTWDLQTASGLPNGSVGRTELAIAPERRQHRLRVVLHRRELVLAHPGRRRQLVPEGQRQQRLRRAVLVQHGPAGAPHGPLDRLSRHGPRLQVHQRRIELDRPLQQLGLEPDRPPGHASSADAPEQSQHDLRRFRRRNLEEHERRVELHQPQRQPEHHAVLRGGHRRPESRRDLRRGPGQQLARAHDLGRLGPADGHGRRFRLPDRSAGLGHLLHHFLPRDLSEDLPLDRRPVRLVRLHHGRRQRDQLQRSRELGHALSRGSDEPEHPLYRHAAGLPVRQLRQPLDRAGPPAT